MNPSFIFASVVSLTTGLIVVMLSIIMYWDQVSNHSAAMQDTVIKDDIYSPDYGGLVNPSTSKAKYYFFNYTNVDEILQGAKPHVEEFGPFVYETTQRR